MSDFDQIHGLDAPLAEKLSAYFSRVIARNRDLSEAYLGQIRHLEQSAAGLEAPGPGDRLPDFLLPGPDGRLVRLAALLDAGPLVVSFNRGHWCSFCRLELAALQRVLPQVRARRAGIVSIMPETARFTRRLAEDLALDFPVLTDLDNGYALQANLMIPLGNAVSRALLSAGSDLASFQGNDAWFVPIPATYVLAPDGRIAAAHVDPDFRRRLDPEGLPALLDGLS